MPRFRLEPVQPYLPLTPWVVRRGARPPSPHPPARLPVVESVAAAGVAEEVVVEEAPLLARAEEQAAVLMAVKELSVSAEGCRAA